MLHEGHALHSLPPLTTPTEDAPRGNQHHTVFRAAFIPVRDPRSALCARRGYCGPHKMLQGDQTRALWQPDECEHEYQSL